MAGGSTYNASTTTPVQQCELSQLFTATRRKAITRTKLLLSMSWRSRLGTITAEYR